MARAEVRHVFPVSAEVLWDLIGDFSDVCRWSGRPAESCTSTGTGPGALRTLRVGEELEIVDRLVEEGPRYYSYEIVSSPFPVASYRATMAVNPVDDATCELCWSGDIEQIGISSQEAAAMFTSFYARGIAMMEKSLEGAGKKAPR